MVPRFLVATCLILLARPAAGAPPPAGASTPLPAPPAPPAPRWTGLAVQAWFQENHLPVIAPDPILDRVAALNSAALSEVGPEVPAGSEAYLHFLLNRHQVRDAVIQAKAFRYQSLGELKRGIGSFLTNRAVGGGFTHFGIGFSPIPTDRAFGSSRTMTLILLRRKVQIRRIQAAVGSSLDLCVELLSGSRPRVLVTTPEGLVIQHNPLPAGDRRRFCSRMPHTVRPGRYQVELMVEDLYGLEVAALFPLFVGVPPPTHPVQKIYPPIRAHSRAMEERLLGLLNASRRAAGARPLRTSAGLVAVARAHSADMRRRGFFGHRSPRNGDLARRLAAAGLNRFTSASENLVLSTGPARAHESLLESPGHRRNMLESWAHPRWHRRDVRPGAGAVLHHAVLRALTHLWIALATCAPRCATCARTRRPVQERPQAAGGGHLHRRAPVCATWRTRPRIFTTIAALTS